MSRPVYVFHLDNEYAQDVIDGVLYSVPPGEPYEFINPFFGKKFIEHMWYHGVVEVELKRVQRGWEFQIEDAVRRATKALEGAEKLYIDQYVETQYNDRLMQGRPATPPSKRQARILGKHKINLEDYGIRPVGSRSSTEGLLEELVKTQNLLVAVLSGQRINPAEIIGMGRTVKATEDMRQEVGLPRGTQAENFVVPSIPDVPEPPRMPVKLYNEGDTLPTEQEMVRDAIANTPEFQGDIHEPVSRPIAPNPDAIDLNKEDLGTSVPIAEALNLDEGRTKIKVPKPRMVIHPHGS